jgi:type I restriction enzyme R subunit
MKELLMNVALGDKSEDTLTSLASRLVRLNSQMTPTERKEFADTVGVSAGKLAENLLNVFDEDAVREKARETYGTPEPTEEQMKMAQKAMAVEAVAPLQAPEAREHIENVRRSHDQIIDNVNPDTVLFAGFDAHQKENVERAIATFREFIDENRDEIIALRIIYNEAYRDRPMVLEKLKALYDKLKAKYLTVERLWDCYAIQKPERVKGTVGKLADLVSLVRFEMGYTENLTPFADRVNTNFQNWVFRRNAGAVHFTEEQMDWLRLIKDHIAVSLSIETDDLELNPFDRKGGLGRFYELFGDEYEEILAEMNIELVA